MKRIVTKVGDLFSVEIDETRVKFFQYVANDLTQLNSSVIRVFKKNYQKGETPDWNEVVKDEIDFYTHTILKVGIKLGHWKKAGKSSEIGVCHVFFRESGDMANPNVKVSEDWYIWKINQPMVRVGKLEGEFQKAEDGGIINSASIVHRINTGENFSHPKSF